MEETPTKKEKFDPKKEVYDEAKLIVQTTSRCNKNCPFCYERKRIKGQEPNPKIPDLKVLGSADNICEDLSEKIYIERISELKENDLIALRGGEITMIENWFEKYVKPALERKLRVVIETNGYFIGNQEYREILEKLKNDNIFIRISFDKQHLAEFRGDKDKIKKEFEKMELFAKDATERGINFGFYSLNIKKDELEKLLENTKLKKYSSKFHFLTYYSDIKKRKLVGKYLRADGTLSETITS